MTNHFFYHLIKIMNSELQNYNIDENNYRESLKNDVVTEGDII